MASSKLTKEIIGATSVAVAAATGYYFYKERSDSPPPEIPHTPPPLGELEKGTKEKKEDKTDKKDAESKLKPVREREEKRKVSETAVKDDRTPHL